MIHSKDSDLQEFDEKSREAVATFPKENYNEIYLVYPQQSNNSVVIPFRNITIEIAWKSLKWFEL